MSGACPDKTRIILLGGDVGVDDLLDGAVLDELLERAVDLVIEGLVVVAQLKAVGFLGVGGGEDRQALVLGDKGLGGAVVDDDGVALAGNQGLEENSPLVAILAPFLRHAEII